MFNRKEKRLNFAKIVFLIGILHFSAEVCKKGYKCTHPFHGRNCNNTVKCAHCNAHDHQTGYEKCPEYQLQQDINYVISEENVSCSVARKVSTGKDIRNPGYNRKSFSYALQNPSSKQMSHGFPTNNKTNKVRESTSPILFQNHKYQ